MGAAASDAAGGWKKWTGAEEEVRSAWKRPGKGGGMEVSQKRLDPDCRPGADNKGAIN